MLNVLRAKEAAVTNPSENRMISAIVAKSGIIIAMGRNKAFKLSGSSTLPAYLIKYKILAKL